MTINGDVPKLAVALGINAPKALIEKIQQQIQEELDSLTLYDDAIPTLNALRNHNIPIAICSNLAFPYGAAIDLLLKDYQPLKGLSYETGTIKPEPGIYRAIINQLQLPPEDCLFVGDTLLADYEGPRQLGMRSYLLGRNARSEENTINSLNDIIRLDEV